MLFVACLTCVIIGNVASMCPTVIIIVESFYVFGVDELSGGEMPPPWSLLLSSAGVVVCIAWIQTVSVVASVSAVAFSFPLRSVVTTAIFLSASIAITSSSTSSASVVAVEMAFDMLLAVRDWSWPGT